MARGLGHSYGGHLVFDGLDVELGAERTGLIGVNGAGKSTLLRILSTGLAPERGTLTYPATRGSLREARRTIGFMPQSLVVPKAVRVADFLAYLAWLREVPRRRRSEVIATAIERADLTSMADAKVGALSGGMFRRLLFAQAILDEPTVLLLDEPTAGLDPEQRLLFREAVLDQSWVGCVLVSSHSFEDLVPIVTRGLMLHDGRFVFDGPMSELAGTGRSGQGPGDHGLPDHGLHELEAAFLRLLDRDGTGS